MHRCLAKEHHHCIHSNSKDFEPEIDNTRLHSEVDDKALLDSNRRGRRAGLIRCACLTEVLRQNDKAWKAKPIWMGRRAKLRHT
jgi:hypothetical protein